MKEVVIQKTGEINLLDELANKECWAHFSMGTIDKLIGSGIILLENGEEGELIIKIKKIIEPGERFLSLCDERSKALDVGLTEEEIVFEDDLFRGMMGIINRMMTKFWILIGAIDQKDGSELAIMIIYFEDYDISMYNILEKKKTNSWVAN